MTATRASAILHGVTAAACLAGFGFVYGLWRRR